MKLLMPIADEEMLPMLIADDEMMPMGMECRWVQGDLAVGVSRRLPVAKEGSRGLKESADGKFSSKEGHKETGDFIPVLL